MFVLLFCFPGTRTPPRAPPGPRAGPASAAWSELAAAVKTWERHWTSNGVWDTALWVKPR